MLRVDIGCGDSKPDGFIGVDICPGAKVDIVADISKEFPFEDNSVDELRAYDVVEHLPDRINTMNEIWRVCKPGARIDILVPSSDGRGAFQDPTHISFWNINSFKYYCVEFPGYLYLCHKYGFKGAFKVLNLEHRQSEDQVIHVKADLEVVKPAPEFIPVQPGQNQPVASSQSGAFHFPTIAPLPQDTLRPFWSVMIPVYNPKPEYLKQMLDSVLSQDLGAEGMQIEVVDDCSTEVDVEALVQEMGQGRVSFYRQPHNLGLIGNWNACLERAKGQWVHLLHQDDCILPGFYTHFQTALEQHPELGAAFCRHSHITSQGDRCYLSPLERETPGVLSNWLDRIGVMQLIQFAAIVVKRSTYEALGGFCPEAASTADWEMWKRIATHYPIWYEPETLACFRVHTLSTSSRLTRSGQNIADTRQAIYVSESYLPKEIAPQLTRQALENYAVYALKTAAQLLPTDAEAAICQIREGLKCSQSAMVQAELLSVFLNNAADRTGSLLQVELDRALQQYKSDPSNTEARQALRRIREQIVQEMVSDSNLFTQPAPSWATAYQTLIASGLQAEPWSEAEAAIVNRLQTEYTANPTATPLLLAATLYCRPEQLPWNLDHPGFDLANLPDWCLNFYLTYTLTPPELFHQVGDADRYCQFMQEWIGYLYDQIFANPESPFWQEIAVRFSEWSTLLPLYFTDSNLEQIYTQRSRILEFALECKGYELDYEFPERDLERQKIRVGVLRNHFTPQTETFTALPAFEHLDRDQFEVILYTTHRTGHSLEQYCRDCVDDFVQLPANLSDQVAVIRADDLDVLIVATNVTVQMNDICQLAAHRLARLQVTLYSSPVTTGLRHIDYYISGDLTEPPEAAQAHYSEQLIQLDGTGYCFNYQFEPAATQVGLTREAVGIPADAVAFVSGANFFKIIPEVREAWAKIIVSVPNSVLVLYPFSPTWSASYARHAFLQDFYAIFDRNGIERDRLIILDTIPVRADVKEHLRLADVYLDSFPYTGSHSTCDPLEVGLPPVVLAGTTLRSRQGAALLRDIDLPELIAEDEASYIQLAIQLGQDATLRQQLRERITQKMQHPRFLDSHDYSSQMGVAMQQLFQEYQVAKLHQDYRLRSINLIALPKWNQPEESLFESLTDLFRTVLTHPDRSNMTLLLGMRSVDLEIADALVGEVVMHLLTTEDIDMGAEEPEIALVNNLDSVRRWQQFLPYLTARMTLAQEDRVHLAYLEEAIEATEGEPLPVYSGK